MRKINFNDIYLLKFCIYGGFSAYDYSTGSKYTILWLILALLVLAFWVVGDVKNIIENSKPTSDV